MTLEMKMQDIRQEGKSEGIEEGIERGKLIGREEGLSDGFIVTAKNLLRINMSLEQIADITTLPIEQVRQLQKETAGAE